MFQPFRIRAALRRLAPFCSKNFSDHRKGREKFTHRTRARGNVSTGLVIVEKEETGESLSCGSGSPGDQRPFSIRSGRIFRKAYRFLSCESQDSARQPTTSSIPTGSSRTVIAPLATYTSHASPNCSVFLTGPTAGAVTVKRVD